MSNAACSDPYPWGRPVPDNLAGDGARQFIVEHGWDLNAEGWMLEPDTEPRTESGSRAGVVTVVTINYKGAEHTITCLNALAELDWPAERLEIICVDNDSRDGSVEQIRTACPEVTLIESTTNSGFTGGCWQGVARSSGEYIAFLNNDARPDPGWLTAAVGALEQDSTVGCVASKMLSWDGTLIDFVDGGMAWNGHGFQPAFESTDDGAWDEPRDMLFACGGAMIVRADLFRETGGFDDRYFMFFEDVDFGWRLNLMGHRVRYVPTSVVYHRHHGSIGKVPSWYHQYLCERNALMTMYKNLSDETLARSFAAAIGLTVRRGFWLGNDNTSALDLRHDPPRDGSTLEVSKTGLSGAFAVDSVFDQFASLHSSRVEVQLRRKKADHELITLFRRPVPWTSLSGSYRQSYEAVVAAFDLHDLYAEPVQVPDAPVQTLDQYRALAAERAERNGTLAQDLRDARREKAKAERALTKAQARIERLEGRSAPASTKKPSKPAKGKQPASASAAARSPRWQRQARRLARRVLRRARQVTAPKPRAGINR
ncbi:MAG TPA: glycosyltransferase family 2 protein [Sporichthyaceae bacterium]|nr:glycosyltransferase family 2 protein [Sporichthyaceae bacterium]